MSIQPKQAPLPPLRFLSTLSGELELFVPLTPGKVKMYNCGPTVYGPQHIGNMRAAVCADIIRRTLTTWGYQVQQVINITDFGHLTSDADEGDDKMSTGLTREGMKLTLENMRILAERYMEEYFTDLDQLGVDRAKITFPRASDYIQEQISVVQSLEQKGYAYQTAQGVYYDVSRFPDYGKLGHINLGGLREGARVQENTQKRGPLDFILWKSDQKLGWESLWGLGFPGWHIECTAMIFTLLGKQIDIHTGGIEHIPVHHNNEIAQAEAATGKQFSRYWLHHDHITIEGRKISKSQGNTIYLHNITDRGFDPLALRYWFLTAHYRTPANFTWEALEGASTALRRLSTFYLELPEGGTPDIPFLVQFYAALSVDLDTPKALALVWGLTKDQELSPTVKKATLKTIDNILGLGLTTAKPVQKLTIKSELPEDIQKLLHDRETARKNKNFTLADELRTNIEGLGYTLKDTPRGQEVSRT